MSQENIDDISLIAKEPNYKDESTMSIYNKLFTLMTPPSKVPVQKACVKEKPKPFCLSNKKEKDYHKKPSFPSSPAVLPKPSSIKKAITAKPVTEFLTDRACFHMSFPQSEYMAEFDLLYSAKIKSINAIDAKYDSELFNLREYLDDSNGSSINNIIYNSVLQDKQEELRAIENEFSHQKAFALSSYTQRASIIKELFTSEIASAIKETHRDLLEQLSKLRSDTKPI